jgi:cyclic pyranopterin phosphate synthase
LSGGRGELRDVLDGIAQPKRPGFASIKFNCVVQRGVNEDDVLALVEQFRGTRHVVRFIEYMDVGTCNGWRAEQVVPSSAVACSASVAAWPLACRRRPRIAGKWRSGMRYRRWSGARSASSRRSARRSAATAIAPGFSADGKLFTCLFAASATICATMLRAGARIEPALLGERIERPVDATWRSLQ